MGSIFTNIVRAISKSPGNNVLSFKHMASDSSAGRTPDGGEMSQIHRHLPFLQGAPAYPKEEEFLAVPGTGPSSGCTRHQCLLHETLTSTEGGARESGLAGWWAEKPAPLPSPYWWPWDKDRQNSFSTDRHRPSQRFQYSCGHIAFTPLMVCFSFSCHQIRPKDMGLMLISKDLRLAHPAGLTRRALRASQCPTR